jgi:hypothetical protein
VDIQIYAKPASLFHENQKNLKLQIPTFKQCDFPREPGNYLSNIKNPRHENAKAANTVIKKIPGSGTSQGL